MIDEGVGFPTGAATLLECVKKWLIRTPWESAQGAAPECTAATVLCELMELSRLWHLLYSMTRRCEEQQQQRTSYGAEHQSASPRTTDDGAQMNCTAVRQRLQHRFKHGGPYVRKLYRATRNTDAMFSSAASKEDCAAQVPLVGMGDIDAADMFWSLILYLSVALCWRRRSSLRAQHCRDACSEDIVSSSRGGSESHPRHLHSSSRSSRPESTRTSLSSSANYPSDPTPRIVTAGPTAAGETGEESLSAALRSHYTLDRAVADDVQSNRCRSVLQRLLPLLESRLSLSQLWRQPSLLAALDVLARGFAMAEGCVHASSLRDDARNTRRCPLCYAATLDNELAVEAFVHLRCYAAAYQGTGNTGVDAGTEQDWQRGGTRDAVNGAELSVWKRGWVAACRIALWNNCKASLDRLCCAPVSCAVTWWGQDQEAYRGVGRQRQQHAECRQLAILVEALWVGWWRAEVWLATYPSSFENSTMGTAIVRDAAARWRTALLFMQVVLPAAVAAARDPRAEDTVDDGGATGRRMKTERLNHQALLSHLVQLPLATEHPQAAGQCRQDKNKKPTCPSESCNAAPARGTVFHWLSQHGDVSLLTLFCRTLDGCTAAMPADQAPVCKSIAASAAAGTASEHTNQAHIVQLGSGRGRCGKALDRSSDRTALQMPEAAGHDAAARTPSFVSQPDPINPGRSLCTATSSLWGLQLVDTLGRNALDIACRRHHLPCVRLLLQAGLSPNSLATLAYDKRVDSLPLTVLNLLYDPSLLEGAGSFDNTSCGGLAQRLRQSTCPAAVASRILAQLSLRLWKEKVQQRSTMPQASDGKCFALDQWLSAYAQCQVAQDRVLRPAMAALELDAYEPTARLVVLSVLTRKLKDWLTTTPPFVRYPANDLPADNSDYPRREEVSSRTSSNTLSRPQLVQPSLRQLRLQHTAALRLYTQLTCPLGRALLRRAVDARCAVCDALTARENRAASVPLIASAATTTLSTAGTASGGRKVAEDEEKNAAAMSTATPLLSAPATSSLALTEPQKVRQELLDLYARVLTDAHALEECLLAEHHQRISAVGAVDGSSERDHRHGRTPPRHLRVTSTPTSGVATLLRGRDDDRHTATMPRPRRNGTGQSNSAPPLYALAVIPSEAALRSARWPAGALRVVEPTLWAFTNTPQKVWLRLPDGIDFDRLLHENSGGGFGVVADDMPLTAPVQRGDLVTFRCSRGGGGGGDDGGGGGRSGDISAIVKQKQRDVGGEERRHGAAFIVQRIFSEWRTLPYLVWRSATTEDKEHQHQPPPSSLVLPYAAAAVSPTGTGVPCMASPPEKIGTDPRRDSITLHACCVSVSYVARIASTQLRNHDPLDWLLQTRGTATHSSSSTESGMGDVLMTLQSSEEWTARWAQTVWAGYQPCWLSNEKNPVVDGIPCSQGDISELAKDGVALCDSNVGLRKRQCEAITCSPSCSSEGCVRDVVHLTDPFSTWDDADAARAHHRFAIHGGGRSLRVLLTSTRGDGGGRHEAQRISLEADWPRRAEAPSASATADVVVGSALGILGGEGSRHWSATAVVEAMHRPDVCTAAAEPAPTSPSAPSQQPNPHMVTVPASIQRFYVHFMTSLSRPSRPGSAAAPTKTAVSVSSTPSQYRGASTVPDQDSTQDEALCRLTAVQEATLGPLLWQWLGLFSLAVRRQEAAPREGLPGPSAIAAPPTMRQELRSCLPRPHHVERLFHIGFTSLLPVAASSGAGGGVSGSRWSPVDPPAPWHGVRPTEYSPPESVLVSALSGLNQYGPLFSAWCALCYTCIDTLLVSRVTSQGNREGQNAAADPCEVDFHEAEEAIRSALRCLLHAWDSAVALPGAWSGESSISDTSVARKNADAWATATLWRTVYETCATSHSSTTAAPSVHEGRGRETSKPLAPPLPMLLWSAQWHRECTRIAAHGTDDVFDTEDAGVPVELMTRVMHYMCHRLKTEVMRCARWHDSGKMATPSTATVGLEEMHAKAAAPPLPSLPAETDASVTCAPSLRIGTLTALALQCPMNPVGNEADRRSGTAKRPRSRRGGVPCRRRRRSWHVSLSSTDDDTDSSEGNGSECSGTSRFLLRQRVLFQVDIACGVLTTFSMCPADSGIAEVPLPPQRQSGADVSRKPAQPADQCYIPFLTSERCLRNGTVHWWTLSDSQRHRQLMAEGRSTTW